MATITQVLRELSAADTSQPVLDIITISQLVRAASMQLLRCRTAESVVCIACQGHFRTVQLVLYHRYTILLVVGIGVHFGSCSFVGSRMRMGHGQRLAAEAVGSGRDVMAAQHILLHLLRYLALDVVIEGGVELRVRQEAAAFSRCNSRGCLLKVLVDLFLYFDKDFFRYVYLPLKRSFQI